jgi:formylglycine-generating enzyme required for sulfatase activity
LKQIDVNAIIKKSIMKQLLILTLLFFCFSIAEADKPYPEKRDLSKSPEKNFIAINENKLLNKFEVSNDDYHQFLLEMKYRVSSDSFNRLYPDTSKWRNLRTYNEPYVIYYFKHPAYANYPVVNISRAQAESYCKWLTEYYMRSEKRKYKSVVFRLPTEGEWIMAYTGKDSSFGFRFPWGYFMKSKPKDVSVNYCEAHQEEIRYKSEIKKPDPNSMKGFLLNSPYYDTINYEKDFHMYEMPAICSGLSNVSYTANVSGKGFKQNKAGFYHMAGNVSEMVQGNKTKGGNYLSPGYYTRADAEDEFEGKSPVYPYIGFRVLMEIIEK